MPEVTITIGGREFEVACQEGEEHFLRAAAQMLDNEAATLLNQIGRMPESRMLLMAGLMLADKTAGVQDKLREAFTTYGQVMTLDPDNDEAHAALEQYRTQPTSV